MSTEPFPKLLDRDLSKVNAKPIIDIASPLLIEVVNHATMAFQRCQVSAGQNPVTGAPSQHLAPFILYQHIIEMTDGLETLIFNSCSGPPILLLRSILEAYLSLKYIFEHDYERRSLCWFCLYIHKRMEAYEIIDPTTNRGKGLKQNVEKEGLSNIAWSSTSLTVQRFKGILSNELSAIEIEYKNVKKSTHRKPNWYSLFGGPKNLHDLAVEVSEEVYYILLYREWSSVMHATDASRFLTKTNGGKPGFHPMHYPAHLKDYAWLGVNFLVLATGQMILKFRPDEDLSSWYESEIKDRLDRLKTLKIDIKPIQV